MQEGTNSAKIRRLLFAGDSWSITLGRVKAEIARLGHPRFADELGPMELNALACQFLRVLRNFVFPLAGSGWRDPAKAPVMAGRWQKFLERCRRAKAALGGWRGAIGVQLYRRGRLLCLRYSWRFMT